MFFTLPNLINEFLRVKSVGTRLILLVVSQDVPENIGHNVLLNAVARFEIASVPRERTKLGVNPSLEK